MYELIQDNMYFSNCDMTSLFFDQEKGRPEKQKEIKTQEINRFV